MGFTISTYIDHTTINLLTIIQYTWKTLANNHIDKEIEELNWN